MLNYHLKFYQFWTFKTKLINYVRFDVWNFAYIQQKWLHVEQKLNRNI